MPVRPVEPDSSPRHAAPENGRPPVRTARTRHERTPEPAPVAGRRAVAGRGPRRARRSRGGAQARRGAEAATTFAGRFLHNLWTANTFTVTLLADRAGDADRRGADHHLRPRRAAPPTPTSSPGPADALTASWDVVSDAYANLFKGSIVDPAAVQALVERQPHLAAGLLPDLGDAHLRRAAGLHRPRGRAGVPRRPVQHRRPGPGDHGRDRRRAGRLPAAAAARAAPARRAARRRCVGGALWGFIPGILKARTGAHEVITTIMLNYVAAALPELADRAERRAGPGPHRRDQQGGRRLRPAAAAARRSAAAGQPRHRARGAGRPGRVAWLLNRSTFGFELRAVGANPDAARTAGISVGRDVRRWSWSSPARSPASAARAMVLGTALRADPAGHRQHRLRRHPGRPARPGQAVGRAARGAAVRRAAGRRQPDAVVLRHLAGAGRPSSRR